MPTPSDDDPLAQFELPPDIMSSTLEHAISDDETRLHERGHAVASKLQRKLKGSIVEFGFPGVLTAHLRSGALARCGGPALGWLVDLQRELGGETETIDAGISNDETDTKVIAEKLAKVLKRL
ncbi:MAG: hypothetical protein ABIP93_16280 [Gemmatimonadaceae bacterium]